MPLSCSSTRRATSANGAVLRRGLIGAFLSGLSLCALAAPENITDGELALLPPYCQDVQAIRYGNEFDRPSPRSPYWVGLMGKPFWSLHHYCWGLIHVRRSQVPGLQPVIRQGMVRAAIADYIYVLDNAPRDFVLAPEIHLRIGEAHLMLAQPAQASEAFQRSRDLKPDYWPAYTRWIDVLVGINQKKAAKDLAETGLRHAPGSKELAERYRKLGGDPSTIAPASPPAAASSPPAAASSPPAAPSSPQAASEPAVALPSASANAR